MSGPPLPPRQPTADPGYNNYSSPPHYADPLVAPRPHRVDPDIGANKWISDEGDERAFTYAMSCDVPLLLWGWCWNWEDEEEAQEPTSTYRVPFCPLDKAGKDDRADPRPQMARDLDNTIPSSTYTTGNGYYQQPALVNPQQQQGRAVSPLPPPGAAGGWNAWAPLGAGGAVSPPQPYPTPAPPSALNVLGTAQRAPSPLPPMPMRLPSPPRDGNLTVPLPSLPALLAALPTVTSPAHDPALQLAWARDVLFLVDRNPAAANDMGPARLGELARAAVPLVLALASTPSPPPESLYLRATFAASAAPPALAALVPPNPRAAFRDFEAAARGGFAGAWYRLGRDYEAFSDFPHALDCLHRGAKAGDPASLHRLGTAHLLGQLALQASVEVALGYLAKAAVRASLQCPAPAYVFALLLLGEFVDPATGRAVGVPGAVVGGVLPPGQSREAYARALLERAAALHFAPAQYKLGHGFEFAVPVGTFPFDPLLSVQWYSLASQAGEAEADMALSKWFLCGAEGAFDKDEALARTFAAKAAAKGLASGEFAMGYYAEVGIGGPTDVGAARGVAAAHGNKDAVERLRALAQPAPQTLGRTEHDALTGDKLVRKRTQARIRSDREAGMSPTLANPHPEPYGAPAPGRQGQGQGPPSAYNGPPGGGYPVQAGAYGGAVQPDPAQRRTRVMELARKSSLAGDAGGHYRKNSAQGGYGAPPGGYTSPPPSGYTSPPPGAGNPHARMPPLQEHAQHRVSAGREGSVPPPQGRVGPPREASLPPGAQAGPRAGTPGAGRGYALTDGGPGPGPGPGSRPGSAAGSVGGRAQGVPPGRRAGTGAGAGGPPPGPGGGAGAGAGGGGGPGSEHEGIVTTTGGGGPATFAEMGFTGAKAEDKECVVM
ncbi:HCP-like protein [Mycena maculata]|uniref:HCP-like protein n=1 Tax=Mycena maculata TaxID=230809 RepID=A0AAD7IZA3_9AGAR|nr:HCP-like protein [Mycena maculata]